MNIAPARYAASVAIAIAGMTLAPVALGADVDVASKVTARASVHLDLDPAAGFDAAAKFRPGMRTSDFLASEWWCGVDASFEDFCEVEDQHRSTPKNIGNILCPPEGEDDYVLEDSCAALLEAGMDDDCRRNSNRGSKTCPGAPVVRPYCNYRTEETGEVAWRWTVSEAEGRLVIGCSQEGYVGYAPGSLDDPGSVASGCLAHGHLRALSFGEEPLRPCRPGEIEITIPAVESD